MGGVFVLVVADLVDDHGAGEDQQVVLAGFDVHGVGVADRQPLLGDRGHHAATVAEGVVVVQETALGLVVVGAGHVDRERTAQQGEDVLAHRRHVAATQVDLPGLPDQGDLLTYEADVGTMFVADVDPLAEQRECLAVEVEPLAAVFVADGEVVAEAEDLLADQVAHVRAGLE